MRSHLFLHEEFMLLALGDKTGTVATSEDVEYPLAAAVLAELILQNRIGLSEEKKGKRLVRIVDSTPVGNQILDKALAKIKNFDRKMSLSDWIESLAWLKNLKRGTALQLCNLGILRDDEETILRLFRRKIYPEIDPEPEQSIIERLRTAIFGDSPDIDPRDAMLIALADMAHLLSKKFGEDELKPRRERIRQISEGNQSAQAGREIVEDMNAALVIVSLLPLNL